jgi:hypothetical protein
LLERSVPVCVATRAFRHEGVDHAAGTLVVLGRRAPGLAKALEGLSAELRSELLTTRSGATESGPNLGSETIVPLIEPKIALVGGEAVSSASFGQIAFLLEQRYGIPYTPLRSMTLPDADLTDYNVLVLPDGGAGAYRRALEPMKDELSAWVRAGGVLVAIGGAAELFADESFGFTSVRLVPAEDPAPEDEPADDAGAQGPGLAEDAEPGPDGASNPAATAQPEAGAAAGADAAADAEAGEPAEATARTRPGAGRARRPSWPVETPGALLLAEPDLRHFLCFGLPARLPVLYFSARALAADPGRRDPVRLSGDAKRLRLSGHLWPEAAEKLKDSSYVVDAAMGGGRVVLFAEDPSFRVLLWDLERILLNALLLGPSH